MSKGLLIGTSEGKPVKVDLAKLVGTKAMIQGNSGAGKSWLLRLVIEQAAADCQVIVLDPEGEFSTLRESLDMLLVGREGEIPTDCKTAAALAHKLIDLRVSAVIDLYDLHPDKRREYVRRFLDAVMAVPKSMYHQILFVIDEAHVFCPERSAGEAESTGAVVSLMSQGRKRGFAGILATQRLSKLHKDAAAECNNVFIGRTWLDNDQQRAGDLLGLSKPDRQKLRDLKAGEWFAFGPSIEPSGVIQFRAGQVKTTHPQYGEKHKVSAPAASKAILRVVPELEEIARQTPDQVHDLDEAKKRIADLRRQLAIAEKSKPAPAAKTETKIVDRPMLKAADVRKIEKSSESLRKTIELGMKKLGELHESTIQKMSRAALPLQSIESAVKALNAAPMPVTSHSPQPASHSKPVPSPTKRPSSHSSAPAEGLTKAMQRILNAVAWWKAFGVEEPAREQVGVAARYAHSSGNFRNMLGGLRTAGLIEYPRENAVRLTDAGNVYAQAPDTPPTIEEAIQMASELLTPAQCRVFGAIVERGRQTREMVGERSGYEPTSGNFRNMLGNLRTLGLIDYPADGEVDLSDLLKAK